MTGFSLVCLRYHNPAELAEKITTIMIYNHLLNFAFEGTGNIDFDEGIKIKKKL
jgi:hypothetical protein